MRAILPNNLFAWAANCCCWSVSSKLATNWLKLAASSWNSVASSGLSLTVRSPLAASVSLVVTRSIDVESRRTIQAAIPKLTKPIERSTIRSVHQYPSASRWDIPAICCGCPGCAAGGLTTLLITSQALIPSGRIINGKIIKKICRCNDCCRRWWIWPQLWAFVGSAECASASSASWSQMIDSVSARSDAGGAETVAGSLVAAGFCSIVFIWLFLSKKVI